jgi:acyl-CoA dehydrogenase
MNFTQPFFEANHSLLRTRVRQWAESNLFASAKINTDVEADALELVRQLGAQGFIRHVVPEAFGGVKKSVEARDLCIVREELARGSALADTMFALQALGSYPITWAGNEEQKDRYLPRVASGGAVAAFAVTEPEAGSDIASLQTRAIRRGSEYNLTGTKRFISNAGIADLYIVFASTDPDKKGQGISAFIVESSVPGLMVKEKTGLLSRHPIGALVLDNCAIPQSAILGKEGEGLKIAFETLNLLRCSVAAAAVGLGQRALDEALRYSQERRQFGQAISQFQAIRFQLAEMSTELEAARLLSYQAAWAIDCGGEDAKRESSMAKLYATEAAQKIVDQALQIHGAAGLIAGSVMERLYRDVRALRIYEGTSEIQKLIIARSLLGKSKIED